MYFQITDISVFISIKGLLDFSYDTERESLGLYQLKYIDASTKIKSFQCCVKKIQHI